MAFTRDLWNGHKELLQPLIGSRKDGSNRRLSSEIVAYFEEVAKCCCCRGWDWRDRQFNSWNALQMWNQETDYDSVEEANMNRFIGIDDEKIILSTLPYWNEEMHSCSLDATRDQSWCPNLFTRFKYFQDLGLWTIQSNDQCRTTQFASLLCW